MLWRSATLLVRKCVYFTIRAVLQETQSEKLCFLQTAGTRLIHPLSSQRKCVTTVTFIPIHHNGIWFSMGSGGIRNKSIKDQKWYKVKPAVTSGKANSKPKYDHHEDGN